MALGSFLGYDSYNNSFIEEQGLRIIPLLADRTIDTNTPYYDDTIYQRFENLTDEVIRVRVETLDAQPITLQLLPLNPTVKYVVGSQTSITEFCLLPKEKNPQLFRLDLQTSTGETLFNGTPTNLTLINSANEIVYKDEQI